MLQLMATAILILVLIDSAHAHYVWLEREGDGPARAYFGEWIDDIREKTGGLLDRFKAPRAFLGMSNDALARKRQAELIIERTAQQLQLLLEETAKALRPFPPFPGAFFTNAVEVNLEGAERTDFGCIVVGEDGGLYELEVKIDFGDGSEFGGMDPVQARDEKLKKLDDLHPRDYIILAYSALTQLTELLLERAEAGA